MHAAGVMTYDPPPLRSRDHRSGDGRTGSAAGPVRRPPTADRGADSARRNGLGTAGLAATAGAVAAVAAGLATARRLGRDVPPLYRSLRAAPRDWRWSGFRVVHYEAGPAEGEPVVLVHSVHAAASAWEMRELFADLAAEHRVLTYDLLGFGASDRPDVDYDATLYRDLLRDFLREIVGGPAHVIASSLSAAHALALAAEEPGLLRSVVLVNPTGLLAQAGGADRGGRLLRNLFRAPWVGEALFNLLVSRPSLRLVSSRLYRDGDLQEAAAEQRYLAAHQPGARFAPAAFLGDALGQNAYMALRNLQVPALAVWSDVEYPLDTHRERAAFVGVAPDVPQVVIEGCGVLPHEERPEEVARAFHDWLGGAYR